MAFSPDNPEGFSLEKASKCARGPIYQLTVALILISFGTLLFLDNVGVVQIRRLYEYWPAIFIALGLVKLVHRPNAVSVLWSLFLIGCGSGFLLINLGILRIRNDGTWPLAIAFITLGFLALVRTVDGRPAKYRRWRTSKFVTWTSPDALNESVVLGALTRKVESTNFLGGEIHSVMGSIELDLRSAQLPAGSRTVTIDIECVMAAVKIQVPESWRVSVQAQGVMGNIEDKTIPPRPDRGIDPPTLVVRGSAVMGAVELEN